MTNSCRLLTCLVSIALVATPAMISIPFQSIAHAQTNSTEWSDRFNQAQKLEDEFPVPTFQRLVLAEK